MNVMKNCLSCILLFSLLLGCTAKTPTYKEVVRTYYQARDHRDYDALKKVVGDSITIVEGDYAMPYSKASFHEQLKWDSIFRPSYTLLQLEEEEQQLIATVRITSLRNQFLKNEAMTCTYRIGFSSEKITSITTMDCQGVNWEVWEAQRDSLVQWIAKNHPELDGFVYDMSMQGALNYMAAIALYTRKSD
ncbi:Hypothetical protein I595_2425 [Croceitalea dokdonensis DOKDO 023]|uniref:Lipoprotein n=1 Tax=Croceitalea dokdonensis DOKDO 023 TaxID=1300341 RepID=A0A0P7AXU8_9FLAO|nr:hypothetical protein [Croceitalea dokdonensis]KPM31161.1 Hypothetical protein I595_2425 [Croceitalea dokdonensis DOKDO 023]